MADLTDDQIKAIIAKRRGEAAPAKPEAAPAPQKSMADGLLNSYLEGVYGLYAGSQKLRAGISQAVGAITDKLGLTQGAEEQATQEFMPTQQALEMASKVSPNVQAGALVGEYAPLVAVPGAIGRTVVSRMATSVPLGAAQGAVEFVEPGSGETREENALKTAVLGGAFQGTAEGALWMVEKAFAKAGRKAADEAPSAWSKEEPPAVSPQEDAGLKAQIISRLEGRLQELEKVNTPAAQEEAAVMRKKLTRLAGRPVAEAHKETRGELEAMFQAQAKLDAVSRDIARFRSDGLNQEEAVARALDNQGILGDTSLEALTDLASKNIARTRGMGLTEASREAQLSTKPGLLAKISPGYAMKATHRQLPNGMYVKDDNAVESAADYILGRFTTAVRSISPRVAYRIRQWDHAAGARENRYLVNAAELHAVNEALAEGVLAKAGTKLSSRQEEFSRALLNQEWDKVRDMINSVSKKELKNPITGQKFKPNAEKIYRNLRTTLNTVFEEKRAAGIDVGFKLGYFPRMVKDFEALRATLDTNTKQQFNTAIKEAAKRKGSDLSIDEQAEIFNKLVKGTPSVAGVKADKGRKIDLVTPELAPAYENAIDGLMNYLRHSAHEIEKARFLGHNPAAPTSEFGSIGQVIAEEFRRGNITEAEQEKLLKLMRTRVAGGDRAPSRGVQSVRNVFYSSLLGHVGTAIQNMTDVGIAGAIYGFRNAAVGAIRSMVPGAKHLKLEDVGINQLIQEMSESRGTARFLNKVFNAVGFKRLDRLGKEAIVNAAHRQMIQQVKTQKGMDKLLQQTVPWMGEEEARALAADLRTGQLTDRVKAALFAKLADLQPLSLSEMPPAYMNMANGRLLYTLKSYVLSSLDLYRRGVYHEAKRDPIAATKNLTRLALAAGLAGATTANINNLIYGRPMEDWGDATVAGMLKHIGLSPYVLEQVASGKAKPSEVMLGLLSPPVGAAPDVAAQLFRDGQASQAMTRIPVFGDFLYYWFGGGMEKAADRKMKKDEEKARQLEKEIFGLEDDTMTKEQMKEWGL